MLLVCVSAVCGLGSWLLKSDNCFRVPCGALNHAYYQDKWSVDSRLNRPSSGGRLAFSRCDGYRAKGEGDLFSELHGDGCQGWNQDRWCGWDHDRDGGDFHRFRYQLTSARQVMHHGEGDLEPMWPLTIAVGRVVDVIEKEGDFWSWRSA